VSDNTSIIRIILEALDRNTGPVIKGATDNVNKLGQATKLTADQEKKMVGEFDNLLKRLDPAYAAQARFTEGQALLERGMKANLITQQQAANGYRLLQSEFQATKDAALEAELGIGRLGGALTAAAVATAIYEVGRASINAAQEAEQAGARIESVLKATGHAAGLTKAELEAMADRLAAASRFDDEELLNAIAVLQTFRNVSETSFERAITLSADLAELMQGDLKSAALQIGKALQEPESGITALTRAGITFSDAQKEVIKQMVESGERAKAMGLILDELERQVGGTADRIDNGMTKATSDATKAWDELTETLGKTKGSEIIVGGALNGITNELKELKDLAENGDWLDRLLYSLKASTGPVFPFLLPDIQTAQKEAQKGADADEKRLAEKGKLEQEINNLLENRAAIEKRLNIERDKASTKNLTEQRDGLRDQIQGYKSLRLAMLNAFDDAGRAAEDAESRAQGFLDRATRVRKSAKDKILDRNIDAIERPDTTGLTPEDAEIVRLKAKDEADAKRSSAIADRLYEASQARARAIEELNKGNVEGAERLLDLSDEQIQRASQFADQINDESRARSALEEIAERLAQNDEKRAEAEQRRSKVESVRREELGKIIAENDARLESLQGDLDSIDSKLKELAERKNTVAIEADEAAFANVNAKLDDLLRKKKALESSSVVAPASGATEVIPALAGGGKPPGSGPKGVDSVYALLDPNEHVWTSAEVDAVGGHEQMYRLRQLARMGLLQRFDVGGAGGASRAHRSVIDRLQMPALGPLANYAGDTINLTIPGLGTYPVRADRKTTTSLRNDVERAALMHGGLKG